MKSLIFFTPRFAASVFLSSGCWLALPVHGSLILQDLFDNMALNVTIDGQGDNSSSLGFNPAANWAVNPGTPSIFTANNFNVDDVVALPGLPAQQSAPGGIWRSGGNDWTTSYWATREMATPINFDADQIVYFSFRLNNAGDSAVGIGLASGSAASSSFVGVGGHWNNHTDVSSQSGANALYLTTGTLDQNLIGNNDGPYASLAHTAPGSLDGDGLVVGRLVLNNLLDHIDVRLYKGGDSIEINLATIPWDLSEDLSVSGSASHLLVWLNGSGTGELDAIRIGTSWEDVTGVTAVPEPSSMLLFLGGTTILFTLRKRAPPIA